MEIPLSTSSNFSICSPISSISNSFGTHSPLRTSGSFARYSNDFTELQIIGKGGYGQVFKVQNILDGCVYAIKRIKLEDNELLNRKILREVNALSRLSHKNIVRYYQSWIESGASNTLSSSPKAPSPSKTNGQPHFDSSSDDDSSSFSGLDEKLKDYSVGLFEFSEGEEDLPPDLVEREKGRQLKEVKKQHSRSLRTSGEFSLFIVCNICFNKYVDWEVSFNEWKLIEVRMQPMNLCEECYKDQLAKSGMDVDCVQIRKKAIMPQYLYIQMEFCEYTLRDLMDSGTLWLEDKHKKIWSIFRQIVEAVAYLHSMNYIHRDCKPSNIFIMGDVVKLGDFGLATGAAVLEHESNSVLDLLAMRHEEQLPGLFSPEKTTNIGTYLYTSPEISNQSKSSTYCEKVDIYSLGIILFELWQPFDTVMERCKTIELLRDTKKLPDEFVSAYTKQSSLISRMIKDDPSPRPDAASILAELPDESKQPVRGFGAHLARVSMENSRLKEETGKLHKTIQALQDRVKLLELENTTLRNKQENVNLIDSSTP